MSHISESCHAYEWVMSHIQTNHLTHIWMSLGTCASASRAIFFSFFPSVPPLHWGYMRHVTHRVHTSKSRHMVASYYRYGEIRHVTHRRRINESCHTHIAMSDTVKCVTIHIRDVSRDSFVTHRRTSHVTGGGFFTVSLLHIGDMCHITHINESCHVGGWVISHTYRNEWSHLCFSLESHRLFHSVPLSYVWHKSRHTSRHTYARVMSRG